jgi:Ca2+-transporting ATPase
MGSGASDVARESAGMILMESDFRGMVEAVFEGRRVSRNLKRSFSYLISFHVPVIVLSLLPPVFRLGDFLLPVHIILLELIVHPISAFTFENLPTGHEGLIRGKTGFEGVAFRALIRGAFLSLCCLGLFWRESSGGQDHSRAVGFAALIFGNGVLVISESWPNLTRRVIWTLVALCVWVVISVRVSPVFSHLHLERVSVPDLILALGVGTIPLSCIAFFTRVKPNQGMLQS